METDPPGYTSVSNFMFLFHIYPFLCGRIRQHYNIVESIIVNTDHNLRAELTVPVAGRTDAVSDGRQRNLDDNANINPGIGRKFFRLFLLL